MNWHKILAAAVTAAIAVAPMLPATPAAIVGIVAGLIGTYVVRPSQVSTTLGTAVAKIPGKAPTLTIVADEPPTGA